MSKLMSRLALIGALSASFNVAAETVTVHMKAVSPTKYLFVPETINVKKGTTVKWINDDKTKMPHTVTSGKVKNKIPTPDGKFDSGMMMEGKEFSHTFKEAGTFDYYCLPHTSMGMLGKVIVK